jgi:hypothetical protein
MKQLRIVVQEPNGLIALSTKSPRTRPVTCSMIDMQLLVDFATDGTTIGLNDTKKVIDLDREPVLTSEMPASIDLSTSLLVDRCLLTAFLHVGPNELLAVDL